MAAVAREPGAAQIQTVSPPEPRPPDPGHTLPDLRLGLPELGQILSEPAQGRNKDEGRHIPEQKSVSTEANVSVELTLNSQDCTEINANVELLPLNPGSPRFSPHVEPLELPNLPLDLFHELLPDLPADPRPLKPPSDPGPAAEQDPVQSAVSPLSLPAAPEAPEAGLSLGQPDGPDRACTDRSRDRAQPRNQERRQTLTPERSGSFTALLEPPARQEGDSEDPLPEIESSSELRPGTHVRVSLDHVIDDALVVSFRVGHKVFSGVLMDLSRRFGPYGIPISVFPPRRELSRRQVQAPPSPEAPPPTGADGAPAAAEASTPLFHQGAPYPPPLFLRDSYHTNLPQPPPRRIKRSRRRYGNSEEPTCMLVRLRPRQVLCDRCKGAAGPRMPPVSTRRRHNPDPPEEHLSAEVKRLRSDDSRPPRPRREGPKTAGGGASAQPLKRQSSNSEVRPPPETASRSSPRSTSSSGVMTRRISSALTPPRVRLKPHRYRTETELQTRPGPERNQTRTKPPPPPLPPRRAGTKVGTRTVPIPETKTGSKYGTKARSKLETKTRSKPESKARCKPEHKVGSKPETKGGSRLETKAGSRLEPKNAGKELNPEPGMSVRKESEVRVITGTRPDLDHVSRHHIRPDPSLDSPVTPSRSRRKQVFPRPNRDFDLDFMGWIGSDSDLDQTEPGLLSPDHDQMIPDRSPDLDPKLNSDTGPRPDQCLHSDLDQKPEPESEPKDQESEAQTSSESVYQEAEPETRPELKLNTKTELEMKPEAMGQELNPGLRSVPSPDPKSDPDPLESMLGDIVDPGVQPRSGSVVESGPFSLDLGSTSPQFIINSAPDLTSKSDSAPNSSRLLGTAGSNAQPDFSPNQGPVCPDQASPCPDQASPCPDQASPCPNQASPCSEQTLLRPDQTPPPSNQAQPRPSDVAQTCPPPGHSGVGVVSSRSGQTRLPRSGAGLGSASSRSDQALPPRSGAGFGGGSASSRSLQKAVGADGRVVSVGDIVWAKIAGFPWWPARVLSLTLCRRGEGGVTMRQEARVAWFGSRTTSLLPLSHTSPFLETFQTRFDRKRKGPYRRAVGEAATAAKQPEARRTLADT